jgi:hypothetical protein
MTEIGAGATSTCFREVRDKVQQDALMVEDYRSFMDGNPSAELLGRLAAYHAAHPEAKTAAAAWLAGRLAQARAMEQRVGSITINVAAGDPDSIARGVGESLRKYAAARTPVPPAPTHATPIPARALNRDR